MKNAVAARIGVEFFICAALLGVFGVINASQAGQSPLPTLVVAAACVGAGIFVREGTPTSRTVGLVVAAVTVAWGAWSLLNHYYLPGSIVATFTLFRLAASAGAFTGTGSLAASPMPGYAQPGYAQPGYAQPGYAQPGYPQPGYPQPPAGYVPPGYGANPYAPPLYAQAPPATPVYGQNPYAPPAVGQPAAPDPGGYFGNPAQPAQPGQPGQAQPPQAGDPRFG